MASSVANSSSRSSSDESARIRDSTRRFGMARNWKARATESEGGPNSFDRMSAVPARFARSRFVVNGTTRTDCRARDNSSLCQMTTGLRPVCSRGRYSPRLAHQSSPRLKVRPGCQGHRSTCRDLQSPRPRPRLGLRQACQESIAADLVGA